MLEYPIKAFLVWLLGFLPYFEIYMAVPAGFILGLDYFSIIFWSVFGTYAIVPVVDIFYDKLNNIERFRRWIEKRQKGPFTKFFAQQADWTLVLLGPFIGVWIAPFLARSIGMSRKKMYIFLFIGVTGYAVLIATMIIAGIDFVGDSLPYWISDLSSHVFFQ